MSMTRRDLLKYSALAAPALLGLPGCTRHEYIRPAQELDLGTVEQLLYRRVHLRKQSVLVSRDIDGWSALSTRCTYIGCDLTYQEPVLLCPCCSTRFSLDGEPYPGFPATTPLPWIQVYAKQEDGHLYANTGKLVSAKTRFTSPEIETAIRELRKRVKTEGLGDEVKIPEVLLGQADGEPGTQFVDENPFLADELEMAK